MAVSIVRVEATFELFDHTADIGLRVTAPTMEALVPAAVQGLYSVIGRLLPGPDAEPFHYQRTGESPAFLMRDFLSELLLIFERDHRIATEPVVRRFTGTSLVVDAQLVSVDEAVSAYDREVKAITYHELAVRPIPDGFEAILIVDI